MVVNGAGLSGDNTIFVSNESIFSGDTVKSREKRIIPGNADLLLLKAFREIDKYDSYLLIEYDVYYNGSINLLIEYVFAQHVGADLVAPFVRKHQGNEAWMWWTSLVSGNEHVPLEERAYSFLQFAMYSRRALETLDAAVQAGWSGHHEVLHATLFRKRGLRVEVFRQSEALSFDVHSFRAVPPRLIGPKGWLHHPVKRLAEDDLVQQQELSKSALNLKERQECAQLILRDVIQLASPESLLDVGCGPGVWLNAAKSLGVKTVLGIDGPWLEGLPHYVEKEEIILHDLRKPPELKRRHDVSLCLEVAHQLEESYADTLVSFLVGSSDFIVFSSAIPFQGGFRHINGQWPSYWMEKFRDHNYRVFDVLRPRHWSNKSIFWWVRQNILVFVRRDAAAKYVGLTENVASPRMLDVVHPEFFMQKVK